MQVSGISCIEYWTVLDVPAALNTTIGVAGTFTFLYADKRPEDNAKDGQFDSTCA